jgi:hypothetical protein
MPPRVPSPGLRNGLLRLPEKPECIDFLPTLYAVNKNIDKDTTTFSIMHDGNAADEYVSNLKKRNFYALENITDAIHMLPLGKICDHHHQKLNHLIADECFPKSLKTNL